MKRTALALQNYNFLSNDEEYIAMLQEENQDLRQQLIENTRERMNLLSNHYFCVRVTRQVKQEIEDMNKSRNEKIAGGQLWQVNGDKS